jgi:uncharacterized protein (TIGR03000 family)
MYSVVLMMALSGSVDAPDCHRNRCDGCYGGGCSSCYGSGCSGGCYGGGYRGGCYGGGCYGGGCYGGGCYGGGCYGGGCYGGRAYGSISGGYYGATSYAGGYGGTPTFYDAAMYSGRTTYQAGYVYGRPLEGEGYYEMNGIDAPATLVVRLPADAKLTVDGSATGSNDSLRTFVSPTLPAGKDYQYTLRAEVMRDGKKVERTRDVNVRAGQTSEVNFNFTEAIPQPRQ